MPKECTDTSSFIKDIDWAGLEPGAYDSNFDPASSAEGCCGRCFNSPGCAGWLYNGSSPYTPCIKIMITANKPKPDKNCPKGYVAQTTFGKGQDCVGGLGPCSQAAKVN